jgi:protein-S-isoprenylcysteine O-methyltransferase Ste14
VNRYAFYFLLFIVPPLAIVLAWLGLATVSTNVLGWVLLLTGLIYAVGIIIASIRRRNFWMARARDRTVREEPGDRSFWVMTVGMMAVLYVSPLEYNYLPAQLPRARGLEIVGIALFITGVAVFIWARRTLGKAYSGHLSVQPDQQLVQSGPYRFICHPAYAGYLLMALGIAAGYSSLLEIASTAIILFPATIYRIHVEDALLAAHFGEQFNQYRREVKRLIPGIW